MDLLPPHHQDTICIIKKVLAVFVLGDGENKVMQYQGKV